jgi:hypothetical protein
MPVLLFLRLLLCIWMALLFLESLCSDYLSLIVIAGAICATIPLALILAWSAGSNVLHAVLVFSLFVLVMITLHIMQLLLR